MAAARSVGTPTAASAVVVGTMRLNRAGRLEAVVSSRQMTAPFRLEAGRPVGRPSVRGAAVRPCRSGSVVTSAGGAHEGKEKGKKPIRIILVRHGESEGNIDETVYMRKPDNQISITARGQEQAAEAGRKILKIVGDGPKGDNLYFYVSPYRRAQETLYYLGRELPRERILGVREDARLREQDFGNFQDEHMGSLKAARLRFSRFFFRFRDGESAADVYDRMTTFRETLRNDMNFGRFGTKQDERATTVIIVSHGLTVRVFLMRWFKWTVEMFEQVRNLHNAGLLVLDRGRGGRYSLVKYHGVRELRTMGFTDEMIEDQNWQWNSSTEELNSDWPTSGPSFFTHFEEKLAAEHACAARLGTEDVEVDANLRCHKINPPHGGDKRGGDNGKGGLSVLEEAAEYRPE
mmetsp:Transcript_16468/g.42212  ORF Transcript_16468/g.42212 Transcript_16468/m.42212 type:complete len:405 (+) Transcript_16468:314-1528(+)